MPNRPTHLVSSGASGGLLAYHLAPKHDHWQLLVEALGGLAGGMAGGILPDLVDPPTHPGHRAIAHGLVPVAALAAAGFQQLDGWQESLRRRADEYALRREQAIDVATGMWLGAIEMLLRIAAGFLAGLLAGYVTHIALDALTPRGLPLFA